MNKGYRIKSILGTIAATTCLLAFQNCGQNFEGASDQDLDSLNAIETASASSRSKTVVFDVNGEPVRFTIKKAEFLDSEDCKIPWERTTPSRIDIDNGSFQVELYVNEDFGGGYVGVAKTTKTQLGVGTAVDDSVKCSDFDKQRRDFSRGGFHAALLFTLKIDGQRYVSSKTGTVRMENDGGAEAAAELEEARNPTLTAEENLQEVIIRIAPNVQYALTEDSTVYMRQGDSACKVTSNIRDVKRVSDGEASEGIINALKTHYENNGRPTCN